MKKFLLSIFAISTVLGSFAQFPTTVTDVSTCVVFRNFNTSDEGFSSPSIYSGDDDVSFFWNQAAGAEIESSGLVARRGSLISPQYLNSLDGQLTVGFRYEAPAGTEYRIRVISGLTTQSLVILATTANGPVYTPLPSTSGNLCLRIDDADLEANAPIRIEFTFRAVAPGNILFDDLALSVVGGPLPVTFQGFTSRSNSDGTTKLLWDVSDEVNVRGYEVLSSTDGTNFSVVGFVPATGSKNYSFDYNALIKGNMFFRIRNVDFDNSTKLSGILRVRGENNVSSDIQLYPVPATTHVFVQHEQVASRATIHVIAQDGKVIKEVRPAAMTNQTQLNISDLRPGVYMVRYNDGEGKVQTVKLVKN